MFFILRQLIEALEPEEPKIRDRKVRFEHLTVNEYFLNFNFDDKKYLENLSLENNSNQININWDLFDHGKNWTEEKLNELNEMCLNGNAIIELLVKSGRNQNPLFNKLSELGWQFESEHGKFYLVHYEPEMIYSQYDDGKALVKYKIPYHPSSFFSSSLVFEKTWINSTLILYFPYKLPELSKEELELEFVLNGNSKKISINDDQKTYTLYQGSKKVYNSKIKLSNKYLGEIDIETPSPGNHKIPLITKYLQN